MMSTRKGDSFGLPIDDVGRACGHQEKLQEFLQQFGDLTERLSQWMSERSQEIDRAYLSLEPDGVAFVVVRKSKRFDPDFEDALSGMDLRVAHDDRFSLIRMRTLALPCSAESTVSSFIDTSCAIVWLAEDINSSPR